MTKMEFESDEYRQRQPMFGTDEQPLKHLVGNEYEMRWDTIHLHTPRECIYIQYTAGKLATTVRPKIGCPKCNGDD